MTTANTRPVARLEGVIWKANASSLKFAPLVAEVTPLAGRASMQPSIPPRKARTTDSITNARRMLRREKPSARRVPISRVRAATIAYMVFMAPNTAPPPITTETKTASPMSAFAVGPAWSS